MPKPSQVPRGKGAPRSAIHHLGLVWLRFPFPATNRGETPSRRRHMAKGRKLTTARSERFLGTTYSQGSAAAADSSELREEDIWSTPEDRDRHVTVSPGEWEARAAPRPREDHHHRRHVGGLSLAFEDPVAGGNNAATTSSSSRIVHQYRAQHDAVSSPRGRHHMAASAPVNVPDWSKILRVDSMESLHEMDDGFDDGGESEMVPPHEYLARSRKMAANSVFEGVGRTLKGRDMRRVRDAVWSQTGFYG